MRFFYDPEIKEKEQFHVLSEEESRHIVKVLRMQEGDKIALLNGVGSLFECVISNANPKKCTIEIVKIYKEAAPDYSIHIALAPTKQLERIEWFVEKATEIGVTEITLVSCKNSERGRTKIDRLEKKAISAMKQSQRYFLPKINEVMDVERFISNHPNGLIAHCYDEEKFSVPDVFQKMNCPILIGPEGDFTANEINLALDNGYKTITLGKNRLRTETAALYACMQAKLIVDLND